MIGGDAAACNTSNRDFWPLMAPIAVASSFSTHYPANQEIYFIRYDLIKWAALNCQGRGKERRSLY